VNSSFPNPSTWAPGTLIPGTPYRVVRPLGQGGMGEVFEVEHDLLGTRRALKVLARHFAGRSDLEERLRVEARALARLKHPNLVEVYDLAAASDGRIFFVMELLDGCTLRDLVRHRGKLGASAAVRVVAQALDGLAAAHSTQMVHRDVKPENVFVCRSGIVKLLDFGIAKAIDASMPAQQITGAGMTVGTPRYMAPEQATGTAVDKRADVYAAGLVLWEALTGRPAFPGDDVHEIIAAKVDEGLPALDPSLGVPVELEAAIARACAPSPAVRFATADAFATELRRAVGEPLEPWALVVTPQPDPALGQLGDLSAIRGAHVASHAIAGPPGAPTVNERGPVVPRRVSDAALTELTQGIEGLVPVDRDAPTPAAMESVPMTGPTGTEMLPAIAEQNAATRLALAAAPPSVPPPCAAHSGGLQPEAPAVSRQRIATIPPATGPRQPPWTWVVAAFALPVVVAIVFAVFVLRGRDNVSAHEASPPAGSGAPPRAAHGAPSVPPAATQPVAGQSGDAPVAATTPAAPSGGSPAKSAGRTATPAESSVASARAPATVVATPASTGDGKRVVRPASGL